jgi:hypothetical protein
MIIKERTLPKKDLKKTKEWTGLAWDDGDDHSSLPLSMVLLTANHLSPMSASLQCFSPVKVITINIQVNRMARRLAGI